MRKILIVPAFLFLVILFSACLSGCTAQGSEVPAEYRWASVEGSQVQEARAGEQFYFNILAMKA